MSCGTRAGVEFTRELCAMHSADTRNAEGMAAASTQKEGGGHPGVGTHLFTGARRTAAGLSLGASYYDVRRPDLASRAFTLCLLELMCCSVFRPPIELFGVTASLSQPNTRC